MSIYSIQTDCDEFHHYEMMVDLDTLMEISDRIKGEKLKDDWVPLPVKKIIMFQDSDFTEFITFPVFNQKAKDILEEHIGSSVEFLPLDYKEENIFLLNVTQLIPLDIENAEVVYFPDNVRILDIEKYDFKEKDIDNAMIFTAKEKPLLDILVTEKFKQIVEENNLTGLKFTKVI